MAKTATKPAVTQDDIDNALAWAVAQGDIVNFRFQFLRSSPLRDASPENIHTPKFDYLQVDDPSDPAFLEAKGMLKDVHLRDQVKMQLEKKGAVQLPSELLLKLADNAVCLGKYSNAAQAYELLRIRPRMQKLFLDQADEALDQNELDKATLGYYIAACLSYDYAAFPEPLPVTAAYHKNALILHAVYPSRPEDSIALQPTEAHLRAAFNYLLIDAAIAHRLDKRPVAVKIAFLNALVRRMDPDWDDFAARYKEACTMIKSYGERLQRIANEKEGIKDAVSDALEEQQDERDPRDICAKLLGHPTENGEWWQYLKDLAFKHPAATLFVTRQAVTKDLEIIMPRFVKDSPIIKALGLNFE